MGISVGDIEGNIEIVGAGEIVGTSEGIVDGFPVGTSDRITVGSCDGNCDGVFDGAIERREDVTKFDSPLLFSSCRTTPTITDTVTIDKATAITARNMRARNSPKRSFIVRVKRWWRLWIMRIPSHGVGLLVV